LIGALLVFVGGGVGAVLRYAATLAIGGPAATLAVNLAGSFAIGLCMPLLPGDGPARLLVMTGLLGGFTTFSAFSLDTMLLAQRGEMGAALTYAGASVILSLAAAAAGLSLGRTWA